MSTHEAEHDTFAPGTLVTIKGLASAAGKPLNGGSGIILGPQFPSDSKNAGRYPVLVYHVVDARDLQHALLTGKRVFRKNHPSLANMVHLEKSIRATNMEEKLDQMCLIFRDVAFTHSQKSFDAYDYKKALFWVTNYCERWPEDYRMRTTYANLLHSVLGHSKEALAILRETIPQMKPDDCLLNEARHDMCCTIVRTEGDPQEALEWALKIGTETEVDKKLATNALSVLRGYCLDYDKRIMDMETGDGPLLRVNLAASAALFEREPDATNMRHVAAGHSLVGDYKEAVRWYRRTLDTGFFEGYWLKRLKDELCCAMMQCPGAPMENYRVIGMVDGKWGCIHKASIGQYKLELQGRGDGTLDGGKYSMRPTAEGVQWTLFPVPDIDNVEVFQNVDLPPKDDK